MGRAQCIGRSAGQYGHLEIDVVIAGVGLGDELVDGHHGLAVKCPGCQIGRVHLIGVDHCACEIGDQDVFGRRADFLKGKLRVRGQ